MLRNCSILLTSSCFEWGLWEKERNAQTHSLFIKSKNVRKQGPFKFKEKVDCGTSHGRKNSDKLAAQKYHLLIGDTFKPTNRGKRKLEVESFDQSERSVFNKRVRGIGGNWTRGSGGNEWDWKWWSRVYMFRGFQMQSVVLFGLLF